MEAATCFLARHSPRRSQKRNPRLRDHAAWPHFGSPAWTARRAGLVESVRMSAGRAPSGSACLALATPTAPASPPSERSLRRRRGYRAKRRLLRKSRPKVRRRRKPPNYHASSFGESALSAGSLLCARPSHPGRCSCTAGATRPFPPDGYLGEDLHLTEVWDRDELKSSRMPKLRNAVMKGIACDVDHTGICIRSQTFVLQELYCGDIV